MNGIHTLTFCRRPMGHSGDHLFGKYAVGQCGIVHEEWLPESPRRVIDYETTNVNQRNAIWQVIHVLDTDQGASELYEAALNLRAVFPKFAEKPDG